jgi:NADH-quinone oxidoreductase subunit L
MRIALVVLCVLSLIGGYVDTPPHFGGVPALSNFLNATLPALEEVHVGPITELITALCASLVFALGLAFAYLLYGRKPLERPEAGMLEQLWLSGWGFDRIYNTLFVRPVLWLARANENDEVDSVFTGFAALTKAANRLLACSQTGALRWYASGLAAGSAVFLIVVLFYR